MKRLIASVVLLLGLLAPTSSDAATVSECLGERAQTSGTLDQLDQSRIDSGELTDNLPTPKLVINWIKGKATINECGTVAELEAQGYGDWYLNAPAAVGGSVSAWVTYFVTPGELSWVSVGSAAWR